MTNFEFILEFTKGSEDYNFDETDTSFLPKFVVPFPKPGIGKFKIEGRPFEEGDKYKFNRNTEGVEMVGADGQSYPSLPEVEEIEYSRVAGIEDEFPEYLTKPIIYVGPVNKNSYNLEFELKREERPKEGGGKSDQIKKRKKSKRKKRKSKRKTKKKKRRNIKLKGGVVGNPCNAESGYYIGYTNDCNSMYEYCAGALDDRSDWYCRERSYGIKGYQNRGPTDYGFEPVKDQELSFSQKLLSAARQRAKRNSLKEGRENYDLIEADGGVFDDPDDEGSF